MALLVLVPGMALGQQDKAPRIAIQRTDHNFGEVRRGETVTHSFVFKNEGTADLLILNVAPS